MRLTSSLLLTLLAAGFLAAVWAPASHAAETDPPFSGTLTVNEPDGRTRTATYTKGLLISATELLENGTIQIERTFKNGREIKRVGTRNGNPWFEIEFAQPPATPETAVAPPVIPAQPRPPETVVDPPGPPTPTKPTLPPPLTTDTAPTAPAATTPDNTTQPETAQPGPETSPAPATSQPEDNATTSAPGTSPQTAEANSTAPQDNTEPGTPLTPATPETATDPENNKTSEPVEPAPASPEEPKTQTKTDDGEHADGHHVRGDKLSALWIIPFAGMLLSIAIFPLVAPHFWHGNYGKVAAGWIVVFCIPFLATYKGDALYEILHIVLLDYVPFIILLTALFTAAGGICLKGSLRGSPAVNTLILFIGTVLASWMGTTGAAMLLIRPILRANAWRKHQVHVVVFFIFLVANIGGSLTPLGDPPLFLGFLKGVDFFWTMKLLPVMAPLAVVLLVVFFIFDSIKFKDEGPPPDDGEKQPLKLEGTFNFVMIACIIGAILFSKSLADGTFKDPEVGKKLAPQIGQAEAKMKMAKDDLKAYTEANPEGPFDESNPEYFNLRKGHLHAVADVNARRAKKTHDETKGLHIYGVIVPYSNLVRDGLMLVIALISLWYTPMYRTEKDDHGHEVPAPGEEETNIRAANGFTWEPILEVAKLFIAIFICMIPALKILQAGVDGELKSVVLAVQSETNDPINMMYFWLTGVLSSFLDNAPTYVVFFNTAGGDPTTLMGPMAQTLLAISCGAVFMGANTYIGNAPNFMVKAIAEENGVKMPSFFGYMAWSVAILIPPFILVTLVYFRS